MIATGVGLVRSEGNAFLGTGVPINFTIRSCTDFLDPLRYDDRINAFGSLHTAEHSLC